jgi:hypothetical protein
MEPRNPPPKCAHPACNCPAAPGSKYCGDYCARAGEVIELRCGCMHDACK